MARGRTGLMSGDGDVPEEAKAFLDAHPEIEAIDLLMPDLSGMARGKRLPRGKLAAVFEDGVRMPGSVFALDITGATVDETGLIWEDGDADRICRPVPGTLVTAPWLDPPAGQLLMTMFEEDGRRFHADPRQALVGVLDQFRRRGWTPVVAVELEFYLVGRARDDEGRPVPPCPPGRARPDSDVQVYDMDTLALYNTLIDGIYRACAAQGLPVEATIAEYAPGQMEVNLTHIADAARAADQAMMLKRAIKGVAGRHGYDATFMAKPFADQAGNGAHVHFSILDEDGGNIFDDGGEAGTNLLHHAIGGLAATMIDAMLLFAPNANSYRRFQEKSYAPMAPTWGYNNRTVALRVPAGPPRAKRIEHRLAGADVNAHVLIAGILAGALYGIENAIDPGAPLEGNAYEQAPPVLPDSWIEAIRQFENSPILPDLLGADFCRVYGACKRAEFARFNAHVTRRELDWYLHSV